MQITNMQKPRDIHARIYDFVIRVIKFTKLLKDNPQNRVIIHQITKSVTSMGANDQEADGTQSRKDFIAKYSIVKKENKETNYWLKVIFDINPEIKKNSLLKEWRYLQDEGLEIVKIVSTIIIKTKNNTE